MDEQTNARQWPIENTSLWPIDKLLPYARNPKTHPPEQIELIARSLARFGQTQAVLLDGDDGPTRGEIIAGHGRVLAAEKLGWTQLRAAEAHGWSDDEKRAYRIMDNELGSERLAPYDMPLLRAELQQLKLDGFEMPLLGFDQEQLIRLGGEFDGKDHPDETPPLPANPITRRGDIWLLGEHRLLCGDCRIGDEVARVLASARINLAFTSPPYAEQRDYDQSSEFKPIAPDDYVAWFEPVAAHVKRHLAADGSWFINIKPSCDGLDTELYVMDLVLAHVRQWGWHFATEFCWERNGVPKSVTQRFKNQFEPIYQFALGRWKMRPDAVRHESENVPRPGGPGVGQTSWRDTQGSNFNAANFGAVKKRLHGTSELMSDHQGSAAAPGEYIGPGLAYPGNRLPTFTASHDATGHTAAFPVGLPRFFCNAYTDTDDVVFDPFMGSGSTLIAAQQINRVGIGCEISPAYCDVTVQRWEALTGQKATLVKGPRHAKSHRGNAVSKVSNRRARRRPSQSPVSARGDAR